MIPMLAVLVIAALAYYYGRRAIEKPKPLDLRPAVPAPPPPRQSPQPDGSTALAKAEKVVAEMFANTRDVTVSGFVWAGSAYDGKLVLTSQRLLWCSYDQKSVALTLAPNEVTKIDAQPSRGRFNRESILEIACIAKGQTKSRIITWFVPPTVEVREVLIALKRYENKHDAVGFAQLLRQWKAGDVDKPLPPTLPPEPTDDNHIPNVNEKDVRQLMQTFQGKSTDELRSMWNSQDLHEFRPEALEAARRILKDRTQDKS